VRGKKGVDAYKINYNKVENCNNYTGKELYNGNISETYWRTASDNVQRKYGYKYDQLNRLKDAIYQKPGITPDLTQVTNAYNENVTYDKNGNIMSLFRNGDLDPQVGTIETDNLVYTYPDNSNQLAKVTDVSNNTSGFKDGNKTGDDYTYDANGSLTTDKNKNITEIVYNHLNLPTKITFGTTGNILFIYNALGQKVQKIVNSLLPAATVTTTDYLGGFQYKNNVLQFFPTAEGYVEPNGSSFKYVFNYLDHLGNVRLSYSDSSQNGIIENSEIIQESNYYPGGLVQKGYNNTITSTNPGQKLLFNGKELQDELDLDWYDFGARMLDRQLNIWRTIDPKAEQMRRWSPYNYCFNNPMRFTDPDGMGPTDWFVNKITGAVVHVEGQSKLTQATADKIGAGAAKNYDRLGADNMFGNNQAANNVRELGASVVENPEGFMKDQGYVKADKVEMKETTYSSKGAFGEENISNEFTIPEKLSDTKITYAKPTELDKRTNISETGNNQPLSSIERTTFTLTTAHNKNESSKSNGISSFITVPLKLISSFLTEYIESKKP
jgi:RHS repeat-associated protein